MSTPTTTTYASEINEMDVIEVQGQRLIVVKVEHIQHPRGGAVVRLIARAGLGAGLQTFVHGSYDELQAVR